jgi:nucleotide-binding universal stress UspA family protein
MTTAVVVGVSPTTGSPTALRWAADEAKIRSVPLRAVMAWRPQRPPSASGGRPPMTLAQTNTEREEEAEQLLRGFVVTAIGSDDGVHCAVVKGNAVTALVSEAENAQLLVIGEPRAGRLNAVRTGLVAPQVVLKARCPVVVMPIGIPVVG